MSHPIFSPNHPTTFRKNQQHQSAPTCAALTQTHTTSISTRQPKATHRPTPTHTYSHLSALIRAVPHLATPKPHVRLSTSGWSAHKSPRSAPPHTPPHTSTHLHTKKIRPRIKRFGGGNFGILYRVSLLGLNYLVNRYEKV